jgi:hypothetical protein
MKQSYENVSKIYPIPSVNCSTGYSVPSRIWLEKFDNPLRMLVIFESCQYPQKNFYEGCQFPQKPSNKFICFNSAWSVSLCSMWTTSLPASAHSELLTSIQDALPTVSIKKKKPTTTSNQDSLLCICICSGALPASTSGFVQALSLLECYSLQFRVCYLSLLRKYYLLV